ncbi:aldo/keto reductase [Streptomyces canus]|jgi:hypothetical protein|uniref:aldo/keto reductase n=1 Tax=Streptomyces TaxID=1883 RepID=UPI0008518CEC
MKPPAAPTVQLNNGVAMPRLGLGTWPLRGDAQQAVTRALRSGYRLIDTAAAYGNENAHPPHRDPARGGLRHHHRPNCAPTTSATAS